MKKKVAEMGRTWGIWSGLGLTVGEMVLKVGSGLMAMLAPEVPVIPAGGQRLGLLGCYWP